MKDKTPEEIVESIPVEKRGHVFHLLGKALGHHEGTAPQTDIGSGDNRPPPPNA